MTNDTNQHWQSVPATGPLLRPAKAAEYLGVALSTYYALAKAGVAPAPVKLFNGGRTSGIPKNQLDALVASRVELTAKN